MGHLDWNAILGWNEQQLDDLRLVGFSYLKQGQYPISISIFEALAVLMPNNTYDLQTLGGLYLETGKHLQALETIERALKLDPTHDITLLNRAKALFALGYKRQGIAQARALEAHQNKQVASQASALLIAYS